MSALTKLREGYEPAPFFDRRGSLAYVITVGAMVFGVALFFGTGFSIDTRLIVGFQLLAATAIFAGWLARRICIERLATGLETTAVVYGQGIAFLLIIYALMAFPIPLVDQQLAAADKALGFYWPDLAAPFRRSDSLTYWGKIIYRSFVWQPALVTISLSVAGRHDRAWRFVTAATISLCLVAFIGPLFPADTPVVFFHVPDWPDLESAWKASEVIHAIREGHRHIDQSMIAGLLTFPSYHACSAILFSWAIYPLKVLRWPVLILNAAMFYLTVVIGGHYVVDLSGGALLAYISIRALRLSTIARFTQSRAEPY